MPTRVISGNQGTAKSGELRFTNQIHDVYNCEAATFNVVKPQSGGGSYPLMIEGAGSPDDIEVYGGTTLGNLDPNMYWGPRPNSGTIYNDWNSGALFGSDANFHFHDWTFGVNGGISHVFDAMRLRGANKHHVIERVTLHGCRDDVLETDTIVDGSVTIRDCLFEDAFSGLSATNSANARIFYLDNVMLSLARYRYLVTDSSFNHGPMWKVDSSSTTPTWVVNNCVFAYPTVVYTPPFGRTAAAFSRWSGSNNYLLFFGTKPGGYPTIPSGFTVLEGQTAINYWNSRRADYFGGTSVPTPTTYKTNICTVNATTGLVTTNTDRTLATTLFPIRATNAGGSDVENLSVTIT
jgi:hypothetical protein